MNKTAQRILQLALAALLLAAGAGESAAGTNETPGVNFRPHTFSSFSANLYEFGGTDVGIFHTWVVGHQHYAQGATYSDATLDLNSGGAGLWNFFTFCTSKSADIMLVTSHGDSIPGPKYVTIGELYPKTPQGLAVRDSVFTYYNAIFEPGSIVKIDWNHYYLIAVTQTFYTTYFMTPHAFAWWATCWSSHLDMTGATEARCFLGYNREVESSKCYCDERRILQRMDGQQGQSNRPLAAAAAGINGACPPGSARLITQGRLNTTLSPSVTAHSPVGTVCVETPGSVSFDTSMDTTVPPSDVIVALGDATLANQTWMGDDRIDFDVVPNAPLPVILYDVIESQARSKADRARLDGNMNPAVNARGPNRDDFMWLTQCPGDTIFIEVLDPIPDPISPVIPGDSTIIVTPIVNNLSSPQSLNLILTDEQGWFTGGPVLLDIAGGEALAVPWKIPVPPGLPAGTQDPLMLTVEGAVDTVFANGNIFVDPVVDLKFDSSPLFMPGMPLPLSLRVENMTNGLLDFANVFYEADSAGGWQVLPEAPDLVTLEPREVFIDELTVVAPPSAPQGSSSPLDFFAEINGEPTQVPVGDIFVGLPLVVEQLEPVAFAAGNPNAQLPFLISNPADVPFAISITADDSNGIPITLIYSSIISPHERITGLLEADIPPDPALVGQQGVVNLQICDDFGFQLDTQFNYTIDPALTVVEIPPSPLYTGKLGGQLFDLTFDLQNNSAQPLLLTIEPSCPDIPLTPPVVEIPIDPSSSGEFTIQSLVAPDRSPGVFQAQLLVQSIDGGPRGIGDSVFDFEIEVRNPVVVDLNARGIAGDPGDIVTLDGTIRNLRTDISMSGGYEWGDQNGWLLGGLIGSYDLAPGASDSLTMDVQLPLNLSAAADSDSVSLAVDMAYDSGLPAQSLASIWVMVLGDSITSAPGGDAPGYDRLAGVFPNPFNPKTRVRFQLAEPGEITLSVLDADGRRVKTLAEGYWDAGTHELSWKGRDDAGRPAASGVYFLQLKTRDRTCASKAILLK